MRVAEPYRIADDGVVVEVHVQPRAGRAGLAGRHGDALRIRVTAPPVEGRANGEVVAVLARALDVAPTTVTLLRGGRSRHKRFAIRGDGTRLAARLEELLEEGRRGRHPRSP